MQNILFFFNREIHGIYNKSIANDLGTVPAVVLSDLYFAIQNHPHILVNDKKHGNNWFFTPYSDMMQRTGLARREIEISFKTLKDSGLLEMKVFGSPALRYLRLNDKRIQNKYGVDG